MTYRRVMGSGQTYEVHVGDVREVCAEFAARGELFDAVLSDPPYGFSFMGRDWDHAVPGPSVWRAVLDCLRPGASLMAFGGSRTFHRLTCAVEDAGAEIRDVLMWMYGSGFPKSYDISKGIDKAAGAECEVVGTRGEFLGLPNGVDVVTGAATPAAQRFNGYGSALKPSYEPIVWAMKARDGSFAHNALTHGVAGINVDAGRIATDCTLVRPAIERQSVSALGNGLGVGTQVEPAGRWPANVILDGAAGAMLDEQTGQLTSGSRKAGEYGYLGGDVYDRRPPGAMPAIEGDSGGASRFYYCAKASRQEREAGLDTFRASNVNDGRQTSIDNAYQRGDTERRNVHPTVKPVDLCRYLAALLLPPRTPGRARRILVPFSGSGSEMIGAMLADWDHVVGVELSEEYAAIARARLKHWKRYRCAKSDAADAEARGQQALF